MQKKIIGIVLGNKMFRNNGEFKLADSGLKSDLNMQKEMWVFVFENKQFRKVGNLRLASSGFNSSLNMQKKCKDSN